MLLAALSKIIKRWKQPKYSLMDQWLNRNVVYTYNGILVSHKKKEETTFIRYQVDEPGGAYAE